MADRLGRDTFPLMLIDMSWRGLRRRLLRRGATGEGHLEADLSVLVSCLHGTRWCIFERQVLNCNRGC